MGKRVFLCTTDDTCPRHGKYIYYCNECQKEWEKKFPRTAKAIDEGRTPATVEKARKADLDAQASSS